MQRHAEEGARIIDRLGFLQDAVPAIRHHHERFDGTGYPDRISGDEIPLGARIIHVADALDSMLTTRIYRAARPVNEALTEVKDKSGSQFCPRCVAALERILPLDSVVGDLPLVEPQPLPRARSRFLSTSRTSLIRLRREAQPLDSGGNRHSRPHLSGRPRGGRLVQQGLRGSRSGCRSARAIARRSRSARAQ